MVSFLKHRRNQFRLTDQSYTLVDSLDTSTNSATNIGDSVHCVASNVFTTEAYTVTKVEVSLYKIGSPTGAITAYLYAAATPGTDAVPDDRNVVATATYEAGDITATSSPGEWIPFEFTGASSWSDSSHYTIVIFYEDGDGSNYIRWHGPSFGSGNYSKNTRPTGPPNATNDASNWTQIDANGGYYYRVYKTP